jgi:hypothetical protein
MLEASHSRSRPTALGPRVRDDLEAGIARALAKTQPALYATLTELLQPGETKAKIMAAVARVTVRY